MHKKVFNGYKMAKWNFSGSLINCYEMFAISERYLQKTLFLAVFFSPVNAIWNVITITIFCILVFIFDPKSMHNVNCYKMDIFINCSAIKIYGKLIFHVCMLFAKLQTASFSAELCTNVHRRYLMSDFIQRTFRHQTSDSQSAIVALILSEFQLRFNEQFEVQTMEKQNASSAKIYLEFPFMLKTITLSVCSSKLWMKLKKYCSASIETMTARQLVVWRRRTWHGLLC